MQVFASFFKFLFRIPFFRKRYFGFYKKIFKPYKLFKGQSVNCRYDKDLVIKADLDEWIQQQVYFFGSWDEPGTKFLKNNLGNGDVFLDIGANVGCYSLIASKIVGPEGQVHSFEPVLNVFERLQLNIQLNQLKNIIANRVAVFEKPGTLELFVSAKENAGMSSIFHHDTESGNIEQVESITIDGYVEKMNIEKIDMIKIDIEGAELFALKGMRKTLLRFHPVIIMELSEEIIQSNLAGKDEVVELLLSLNYTKNRIDSNGNVSEFMSMGSEYSNFAFFPPKY